MAPPGADGRGLRGSRTQECGGGSSSQRSPQTWPRQRQSASGRKRRRIRPGGRPHPTLPSLGHFDTHDPASGRWPVSRARGRRRAGRWTILDVFQSIVTLRGSVSSRQGSGEAHCGLYVFVSDHSALRSLQEHLRRAECVAEPARAHELEVYVPSAPSDRQARREVEVYVAVWQASHPGVEAYVLGPLTASDSR